MEASFESRGRFQCHPRSIDSLAQSITPSIQTVEDMATTCASSTALAAMQLVLAASQAEEEVRDGRLIPLVEYFDLDRTCFFEFFTWPHETLPSTCCQYSEYAASSSNKRLSCDPAAIAAVGHLIPVLGRCSPVDIRA